MNIVKIVVLVVPLLTYPYLIKTVGSEKFGLVIWIWAIIDLLIICINFGFEISITKHISIYRTNINKLSKIYTSVLYIKLILFIFILLIMYLLYENVELLNQNKDLFIYSSFMIIPEIFMPLWYFRGIEKMQFVALLTSSTKVLFAISIFLLIKSPEDYLYVPILYTLSGIINAIIANYILIIKDKIRITKISIQRISFYFKESLPLFASNSIYIIREKASIIFVEKFLGLEYVAYWDLVIKIINIFTMAFQVISSSFYPYMARSKNLRLLFKVMILSTILSTFLYLIMYSFSEEVVYLIFNNSNYDMQIMLEILGLTIILNTINAFIGLNILSIFSKNFLYFISSLIATSVYFMIFYIINLSNTILNITNFSWIIVFVIFLEMISRIILSKNIIQNNWNTI